MIESLYHEQPIIGLEFSQSGFRVMSVDPQNWNVLGYGAADVAIGQGLRNITPDDAIRLSRVLSELLREHIIGSLPNSSHPHVAISIPAALTYTRLITLPKDAEDNLLEAVHLEADQYIPIPSAELYIDYEIIDSTDKTMNVLICAAPARIVDTVIAIAVKAGLSAVHIEPSTMAVARLIAATESGELTTLIIDIGASDTNISVLDKSIRVSGSVEVGDDTFTNALMKQLSIDKKAALQVKTLRGLSAGHQRAKVLSAVEIHLEKIVNETKKIIRFYDERLNSEAAVEQVLIVGEGSNTPGIGEYFTEKLILPARVASPWQELHFNKVGMPHKQLKPQLTTAAGLALINPKEIK